MFKPVGFLQAALVALLTACSATPATRQATEAPSAATGPTPNTTLPAPGEPAAALDADEKTYARQIAQTRQIPISHVEQRLSQARYNARVAELISPAKTARIRRSWPVYRQRVVEPVRIRAGVRFWQEHQATLEHTARQYGVPASVIVAIIGVETVYGRHTGGFPVLDTLYTLSFRHPEPARPERVQMFREQLADLIELDYAGQLDAAQVRGSFAGAMGLPQFMPGSLMRYAVDGDGDKRIDLHGSVADAVASVANFLIEHGWQPGLPVFAPVQLPANPGELVAGGLAPTLTWQELQAAHAATGAAPGAAWQAHKLGVIDLVDEPRQRVEYRTATPNFFAITHYNRSYFYAASVADLAQALEAAHAKQAAR